VSVGLAGALCGYLVLFGPLALFPHVLGTRGAGLVLTCLPAGFAAAALAADRVLPSRLGARARVITGAAVSVAGCAGLLAAPGSAPLAGALLLLTGAGLGLLIPANNSAIMTAIPARMSASGGGLVNMARGLGTALGVAIVTLCLHLSTDGERLALVTLALAGTVAGITGLASGKQSSTMDNVQGAL
jgi:fucose permease